MHSESMGRTALTRRSFLGGALVAGGAGATFVLAGCASQDDKQAPGPAASGDTLKQVDGRYITALGLNLSFVEVMVAKEQGFFDKQGLNLEIKGGSGTATAIQAVLGNTVDISRTAAINAIVAAAKQDAPLVSIGTVRQRSQFDVVSLASKPLKSPKELAGKTVGVVSAGGSTENLLDMMLLSAGVDRASVKRPITGVGTAAYELAKKGQIDAWISVDTDRQTINDELGPVSYFNSDDFAKVPSDTYNVSQKMIESGSDMPVRFLAGVIQAMEFASDKSNWPQVIKDLQVYAPDSNAELSMKSMPILIDGWKAKDNEFLRLDDDAYKMAQELMAKAGLIKAPVPLDVILYHKYLDEARKRV